MSGTVLDLLEFVTVACAFDEHTVALAAAAATLCQRTGKKLCLLHAVEPWADMPHAAPFGEGSPLWDVTQRVEGNARDIALGRLAEVASTLPPEVSVKKIVVRGKPAGTLGPAALAAGSSLLVVGADFGNARYLPRGLSTALSLMVSSPVPVMVMDSSVTPSPIGKHPRILLADDLGPESEAAVAFAFALVTSLGPGSCLHHVHINSLTLEKLRAGLGMAPGPLAPAASTEALFTAMLDGLRDRLDERAEAFRDYLEASGGTYTADIVTGDVTGQLATIAAATSPHLLIFGRHHAYHTKPFFIGRVPYRSMLGLKRPVIVVPNS